jgi:hypothetical protein
MPEVDEEPRESADLDWHQRPAAIVASGIGALVAVAIIVYAVLQTSQDSNQVPGFISPMTSTTSSAMSHGTSSTTTTSAQTPTGTSSATLIYPSPAPPPTTAEEPERTTTRTPTISNMYPTTTTRNPAGAY